MLLMLLMLLMLIHLNLVYFYHILPMTHAKKLLSHQVLAGLAEPVPDSSSFASSALSSAPPVKHTTTADSARLENCDRLEQR